MLANLLHSEPDEHTRHSSSSGVSGDDSATSPWNRTPSSPYVKSPWTVHATHQPGPCSGPPAFLAGSLVREEGHIYSLAASGDLLYTGSDSKNIRVWRKQREFSGFKSSSGLVKAIVLAGERIFTGHQDGKIRVWRVSARNPTVHRRVGSLPKLKDYLKSSFKPSNYVEVRRHKTAVWIKHYDAVSCLSMSNDRTVLYSGSWDKTFKAWRIADSRCLDSVAAHDDAVNAVVAGPDNLIFTGSADGTVKAWRCEASGKALQHKLVQVLLRQESAVTSLAVSSDYLYSGSSDGLVNFWEKGLVHVGTLRGHTLAVLCLATAGLIVVSGSADKTMCVWKREGSEGAHACLAVLTGHLGPVKCLAVESDGEIEGRWVVYSGSLDKSVKVWKVNEGDPHRRSDVASDGFGQDGSFSFLSPGINVGPESKSRY